MAVIGYARVSTKDQDLSAQISELKTAGASRVFSDHGFSSRKAHRPGWDACLDYLREEDILVVRSLDRLAGSEVLALEIIRELADRSIRLKSLTEPFLDIDTHSPMGQAIISIMAVLAELRVGAIRENTRRGLAHARASGKSVGRPKSLTPPKLEAVKAMLNQGMSQKQVAQIMGVSRSTISRSLNR